MNRDRRERGRVMSEYGIQAAHFREGIDVGRLNAKRTAFTDKHDATDMTLAAVAQYVELHFGGGLDATFPELGLALEVRTRSLPAPTHRPDRDQTESEAEHG